MRKIILRVIFLLNAMQLLNAQSNETIIRASDPKSGDGFGTSLKVDGNFLIIGSSGNDQTASNAGAAYIFEFDGTNWIEQAKLIASDGGAQDRFGTSVSIFGNYAIVGAKGKDNSTGAAYVFNRQGDNWVQITKLVADDGQPADQFGNSVKNDSNYAVIGSPGSSSNGITTGAAYIYVRNGTNWNQLEKIVPADGTAGNGFGSSVSISNGYIAVGSPNNSSVASTAGAVYIYHNLNNYFSFDCKLVSADSSKGSKLGNSVSITSDYLISGAYLDNSKNTNSGSAYIYFRSDTNWYFAQKLTPPDSIANENFGYRVYIKDSVAIVGVPNYDNHRGKAFVYSKKDTSWKELLSIIPSASDTGDNFGSAVSVLGNKVIIGSPNNQKTGAVYVYDISNITAISPGKVLKNPKGYFLEQNFPNPFNPSTVITYSVPQAGFVTIKVYDILGRDVKTLVNETKGPGNYSIRFNSEALPSGIYFYRITAGDFSQTRKMVLLK